MNIKLILLTISALLLNIVILLYLAINGFGYVNKSDYLTQKVLDTAEPINVTIDVDFISKF